LILVSDPSCIEEVLVTKNKSFKKHYVTRMLKPILGNGLLLNEGQSWLKQRRLIQPAFSRRFTQDFARIVNLHSSRLAEQWRQPRRRDLYQDMTQLTVDIAAHAFLGISDTAASKEIGDCLEVIHADFEWRFQRAWNPPLWIPSSRNLKLRRAINRLTGILDRMIEERRKDTDDRHDALSLLLRAEDEHGERMPLRLLRDEVMTLLLAGHDTTANGLTWTWFLLSQHPVVVARLRETLCHWTVHESPLENLSFVRSVVKESMRLLPPVYLFGREAIQDVDIGSYRISKGDSVVMSQWVVHRDEQYYPEPDRFCPDRWTPEFEKQLPKYAYFPFGGGPRACIGKHVAMLEAELIVANLASEFSIQLESPDVVEPWPTVTLRPKDAVWAKVLKNAGQTAKGDRAVVPRQRERPLRCDHG
jgi:cytochrome P450